MWAKSIESFVDAKIERARKDGAEAAVEGKSRIAPPWFPKGSALRRAWEEGFDAANDHVDRTRSEASS